MLAEAITIFQLNTGVIALDKRGALSVAEVGAGNDLANQRSTSVKTTYSLQQAISLSSHSDIMSASIMNSIDEERGLAKDKLIGRLSSFYSYDENWDNEGSEQPNLQAVDDAIAFIASLSFGIPLPKSMPMPDGNIALYWDLGSRYVELGFSGDGEAYAFGERQNAEPIYLNQLKSAELVGKSSLPLSLREIISS